MKYSKYYGLLFFCIYFVVLLLQREAIEASLAKALLNDFDRPLQMTWTSYIFMSLTGALVFTMMPYFKGLGIFVILLTKTLEIKYSQIVEVVLTAYWFVILGVLIKLPVILSRDNIFIDTSVLSPFEKYFSDGFSNILIRDTDVFIIGYLVLSMILLKRATKVSTSLTVIAVMLPYFLLLAFNLSFSGYIGT